MRGYTLLIKATAFQEAYHMTPCNEGLLEKAMELYHEAAKDEDERRTKGDKPDHIHLTYL